MNAAPDDKPLILLVAMPASIHAARWVNLVRNGGFRIVVFPSVLQEACPELYPLRDVRSRADLATLHPGDIGLYPNAAIEPLTQEDVDAPHRYPHAIPAGGYQCGNYPHAASLERAIRALQPDLIHSMELQHGGYLVLECKRQMGTPFPTWLASSWGSDIFLYCKVRVHRPVLATLLSEVDALHSDCARDIKWVQRKGHTPALFPQMPASGGIEFSEYPHPDAFPPPSQRKTIIIKGYHNWSGRGMHILAALHLIAPALRGYRILIVQPANLLQPMAQRLADVDGLDVTLAPKLNTNKEVVQRLASARLAVGYGISDGISTTLLEAMTVGTFMVQASTCCGNEWVDNGLTGLMVPPHDVDALSQAILRAATDNALVDEAVAPNRRTIETRWSATVNSQCIGRAYERLIKGQSLQDV